MTLSAPASAQGVVATYDGFVYSTGNLDGESGGTGNWKDPWSGDSEIDVETPGFTYTDTSGNQLTVSGNRVGKSGNSLKIIKRSLNSKVNSGTMWASALIDGRSGSRIHNVGLGDGLFFGQGTKDSGTSRIGLADSDGSTDEAAASFDVDLLHFLVVRIDFSGGSEEAWLWVDPVLDSEPATGVANAHLASVKEFEFDYVQLQLQRKSSQAGLDEVRLGSTFAEVTPHTSSAVCGDGTVDAGEDCDGGACCKTDGSCTFADLGETCGDGASACSAQDTCDGSGTCDVNDLLATTTCGDAGDQCTNQDFCDGSGLCGDSGFIAADTSCGDAGTVCSAQDTCDGSGTCDVNDLIATTTCGDAGGECMNQDYCDGSGSCGDSGIVANGSVCSDEDPETFDDQCSVGICLGEAAPDVPMSSPPFRMLLVAALGLIGGLASYRKYGMSNRA